MLPGEIAAVGHNAGWVGQDLVTAVAVAMAESSGNPNAHATQGEDSRGLWQINVRAHPNLASQNLYDPQTNANAAFGIWKAQGWGPWSAHSKPPYPYLLYMPIAQAAVAAGYALNPGAALKDNPVLPEELKKAVDGTGGALIEAVRTPVKVLTWMTDPGTMMRAAKLIVGLGLLYIGLNIFVRPAIEPVTGAVSGAVTKVASAKTSVMKVAK